jgi:lysophospholipase L1-like esterase
MAARPAYDAPLMATPPTITQSASGAAAATFPVPYGHAAIRWASPTSDTGFSAQPVGPHRPDGTSPQGAANRFAFDFDGRYLDLYIPASATVTWRLWVNEQAHAAAPAALPGGSGGGGILHVDFGASSYGFPRRLVFEFEDTATPFQLFGMNIEPTASIFPPTIASPRVMIVGDSYAAGQGADRYSEGYAVTLGRMLGWADCWSASTAASSTGLVDDALPTFGPYQSRITADVIPYAPDLVIVQGSLNDYAYIGQNKIGPALTLYVNTLRAALPDCEVLATSPLFTGAPPASYTTVRDEMKTAATALNVPFVDLFSPIDPFYGTGNSGAPNGSGNADHYLSADAIHPTKEGHYVLASVLAGLIGRALRSS